MSLFTLLVACNLLHRPPDPCVLPDPAHVALRDLDDACARGCSQLCEPAASASFALTDDDRAILAATRRCAAGDRTACYERGVLLGGKYRSSEERTEAVRVLTEFCGGGVDQAACDQLAWIYMRGGPGPDTDRAAGSAIIEQACYADDAPERNRFCAVLGNLNLRLDRTADAEAARFYTRACALGDERSCHLMTDPALGKYITQGGQ